VFTKKDGFHIFLITEASTVRSCFRVSVFSSLQYCSPRESRFGLRSSASSTTNKGRVNHFDAHCCHMDTATKHPLPDLVKPSFHSFVIVAIRLQMLSPYGNSGHQRINGLVLILRRQVLVLVLTLVRMKSLVIYQD